MHANENESKRHSRIPLLEAVFSQSLNGTVATNKGETNSKRRELGLTNPEDSAFLLRRLNHCDAVLSTYESIKNERGAIRSKGKPQIPWFFAVTSANRPKLAETPVWIQAGIPSASVTFNDWSQENKESEFDSIDSETSVRSMTSSTQEFLERLYHQGVRRLCVLGGPTLCAHLMQLGVLQELSLSICPIIGGSSSYGRLFENSIFGHFSKLQLLSCESRNSTLHLRYSIL